jgi:hypothetical protein
MLYNIPVKLSALYALVLYFASQPIIGCFTGVGIMRAQQAINKVCRLQVYSPGRE